MTRAFTPILRALLPEQIRGPLRTARSRWRLNRMITRTERRYTAHYRQARRVFRADGHAADHLIELDDVGVRVLRPGGAGGLIDLPASYPELVDRIKASVAARLDNPSHSSFYPPVAAGAAPDRDTIAVRARDVLDIDGLEELSAHLLDQVERKIYGSYALVDKVYVYRSLVGDQQPRVSWLWHYDLHPRAMLKILIYLTDVDEGAAPFQYLGTQDSGRAVRVGRMDLSREGRIRDSNLRKLQTRGFAPRTVIGPAGTLILFDDNVVHRAVLAERRHRDVVVLQIRPACFRARPRIDARWTGSFQHCNVPPDPWATELATR